MNIKTIPTPHTLDEQPAHFRVTNFTRTPLVPENGPDEFTIHLEFPRIDRKEGVGVSRMQLTEARLNALRDAVESKAIYFADLKAPTAFPQKLSYDFLDRLLSAIEHRQIVPEQTKAN